MIPDRRISWILNGELTHVLPESVGVSNSELQLLGRSGAIKITETDKGVEIKWVMFSANWASMYYLIESLHLYSGPITFRYFLSGWFSETIETIEGATSRAKQLMAKSDVHVSQHTFVQRADPGKTYVPHVLRDTLTDMTALPEFSVDCIFDTETSKFLVNRVGSQSALAQVFGISPVSVPCLTGNSYDEIVSEAYLNVLSNDKPCYDHVIAAMRLPDQSVNWITYQRVILPHRFPNGKKGVSISSQLATVDIKVV
ncbi:hypothetical protein MNBD_ALPHA08-1535 [hydrothermal vent metagenome]|uniref:Uncharacterized protein n=1 Tax=hydrothermal vent metagenome TaxID=652676 RepID=A0A3B0S1H3_9ZZZZ